MPIDNTQLTALVNDLEAKEQLFADATAANTTAQAASAAAQAAAAVTLNSQVSAHADLSVSIDALVTFVNALK